MVFCRAAVCEQCLGALNFNLVGQTFVLSIKAGPNKVFGLKKEYRNAL